MRIHSNRQLAYFVLLSVALALGVGNNALAQVESGTINGTVVDSTGAVVSGARVNVTSSTTAQVRGTEARYLQFRVEFFDAFNHPNFTGISGLTAFAPPEVLPGQTQTGRLDLSQMGNVLSAFAPRQVQFALKFYF
jgi:hypothetical protein